MASGTYIDKDFWSDGDFRTCQEKLLAIYIFAYTDAAGVMAWDLDHVRGSTKLSKQAARKILDLFRARGKLWISDDGRYIWWRAKIKYFLFKGKSSDSQRKAVARRLAAWDRQGTFGLGFADRVRKLYLEYYDMRIRRLKPEPEADGVQTEMDGVK